MKQAVEYFCGLRYKLQMIGITCEGTALFYGDNKSVFSNTTVPAYNLKKNMNSLSYHFFREICVRDEWRTACVNTNLNLADLLTNPLPSGEKRWRFLRRFYICFNSNKFFWEDGPGKVPDTTPCIWFRGLQIFYWVTFFPG